MSKEVYYDMGTRANIDLLQEECAELISACNKYKRAQGFGFPTPCTIDKAVNNIVEEIADVENCIANVKRLLGIEQSEVDAIIAAKDERMEQRINGRKG